MNKCVVKAIGMFIFGVAVGAGVTNYVMKTKYEKIVQEEIDSIKETLGKKNEKSVINDEENSFDDTDIINDNYDNMINNLGYNHASLKTVTSINKDIEYEPQTEPYIIDVNGFLDDKNNYDKLTLSFYADDQTLVDEQDEVITNEIQLIGDDDLFINFGSNLLDNPDVMYIRNNKMLADLEIICVHSSFEDHMIDPS